VIVAIDDLMVINVYLPYHSSTSLSMIDMILDEIVSVIFYFPHTHCIFAGDMNCSLHDTSRTATRIRSFMNEVGLLFCDHNILMDGPVTYNHLSQGASSYIDFILVSKYLSTTLLNYEIIDFDLNLLDHLPVLASFSFNIDNKFTPTESVPADDALRQIINNKR